MKSLANAGSGSNPWQDQSEATMESDVSGLQSFLTFRQKFEHLPPKRPIEDTNSLEVFLQVLDSLDTIRAQALEFDERHALLNYSDLLMASQMQEHTRAFQMLAKNLKLIQVNRSAILTSVASLSR